MEPGERICWGVGEGGDPVVEVVAVRHLNRNQAENMLRLLNVNVEQAANRLKALTAQRDDLARLLAAGPNRP
jgi:hypothetical protein